MKTLELNGTKVELTEENGIVKVNVLTENASVKVNNVSVWEMFSEEEYKNIPPAYRSFIKKTKDYIESNEKGVSVDCYIDDARTQGTFYFPLNQVEPVLVRFDYVDSLEDLHSTLLDYTEQVIADEVKEMMSVIDTKLREAIEKKGFKWKYSHSMEEYMYGWWDIVIEPGKWNEEGFIECWKIIEDFNKRIREIFNTYVY